MIDPVFYDTETCGFHGPICLIQYAYGNGDIQLFSPWTEKIRDSIDLIEELVHHEGGMVGFNLAFDHFHLQQMYTTLRLLNPDRYLEDCMDEYIEAEPEARLGPCLKPVKALDLMLHARKGEYQSTMDRSPIKIKRIPTALAQPLADELTKRIQLKDVYFARQKDKTQRWKVADIKDEDDQVVPDFKNVVLNFNPSSSLKALAEDIFGIEKATRFDDVDVPKRYRPVEQGWAPFALAPFKDSDGVWRQPKKLQWFGKWPQMIKEHISHWAYNRLARKYAEDDVVYTRKLYDHFGQPELGDDDSELACMVGSVRWRGHAIDIPKIRALKDKAINVQKTAKYNFRSPEVCRTYLMQVTTPEEQIGMLKDGKISTGKKILEDMLPWGESVVCEDCNGQSCDNCIGGIKLLNEGTHPAAIRAKEIMDFRAAGKEIDVYQKLEAAGRFHTSFKVIGALSSRMSGADGLNAQGINHAKETRRCFPLADNGLHNCGGDFAGFEVTLADAVYGDPLLREDLLTMRPCPRCKGDGCFECEDQGEVSTKIHALFGQYLFPPMTYDEIVATDGAGGLADKYTRSKQGVFALLYGGEEHTLSTRVGISEDNAYNANKRWGERYTVWSDERMKIFNGIHWSGWQDSNLRC